ncbi:urea carboxylase [Stenotrophobium rhamnosiphilum]|uniref:Urea carboxylase n=2 Tax=Stenotrophobium rhamnosiphilum TaxID=2029166 RepID=A0A2T5MI12_9GAMM|nr:urea carboxylase [Stenotrophobium rhamnosiphilum]
MTVNVSANTAAHIEQNRSRYLELKAAGQGSQRPLPPHTQRNGAALDASKITHREVIPGGWYWPVRIERGQTLRLLNVNATPGISVMIWNADDTSERYNAGDTVKVQWTAELRKGRVLFSDMGRVLASITEDTCGRHDTLVGGSTSKSNLEKYGDASLRNSRDNLMLAAGKYGLSRRDLAPAITFFAPVSTDAEGRFVWNEGVLQSGDFVDLRADMNLLIAVSNCPHPLAPAATYAPSDIEAIVFQAEPVQPDDLCRSLSAEASRGFENTDPLFR